MDTGLVERLRICAKMAGSGDALSAKTGIPRRTLENYLSGESEPKISRVVEIADAVGLSVSWLATGKGSMHPDAEAAALEAERKDPLRDLIAAQAWMDEDVMGGLADAIAGAYKDAKARISPADLGRLCARKYAQIAAATTIREERLAMIKLVEMQVRADLAAAAAQPGTGKRAG